MVARRDAQSAAEGGRIPQVMRSAPATVLVAGGAGFLGSNLCERLLDDGQVVVCLDDLSTGAARNVAGLIGRPGFSLVRQDVTAPITGHVDRIYNLACPASPPRYQADPIRTFRTSVLGALNLLDFAESTGARILQASTSEVYGDPEVHPQPESYWGRVNPFGPRACYDEGKRAAETLFHDYHERRSVDTRIARIFNTYGPRMDPADGRVVSNFVVQALRGQDITIYGDGSQTRSFCYADDLIDGLIRLMNVPQPLHAPVNLGNTGEFTVLELAELVIELSGSHSRIVHRPLPVDDPRQRRPDISRARAELDWEPRVALATGLAHTIAYFDDLLRSVDITVQVS
jgi:UDP-glucuronate decarboxylase